MFGAELCSSDSLKPDQREYFAIKILSINKTVNKPSNVIMCFDKGKKKYAKKTSIMQDL